MKKSFTENPKSDSEKKGAFLKKHGTIDVAKAIKEKHEAQEKFTQDVAELEANIKEFTGRPEPLLDPISGKPLCWIRNPTQEEWEALVPKEFWDFQGNPDGVPQDIQQKYADHQFEMMAKLVTRPEHDAAWWKKNANIPFQMLFQEHLIKVYEDLGIKIGNF
jgi:hypothetical protein